MNKALLIFMLALAVDGAWANTMVIDPDDYATGTNLSNISPLATLSTTDNQSVYAMDLAPNAADGANTQGLGHKVFGYSGNNEWIYQPWESPAAGALQIGFHATVTHFSILVAELFWDAGPGDDPLFGQVYDNHNNFIGSLSTFGGAEVKLAQIDPSDASHGYWAYWTLEFSGTNIAKVIIGGDSEPTTLDRLTFDYTPVPEPSPGALLLLAGALLVIRKRQLSEYAAP